MWGMVGISAAATGCCNEFQIIHMNSGKVFGCSLTWRHNVSFLTHLSNVCGFGICYLLYLYILLDIFNIVNNCVNLLFDFRLPTLHLAKPVCLEQAVLLFFVFILPGLSAGRIF